MRLNILLIISFGIMALLISISGFIFVSSSRNLFDKIDLEIREDLYSINHLSDLNHLANLIRYYDEVLTMSSRNYAFSSNEEWKIRYYDTAPRLDAAIKEAIEQGSDNDKVIFKRIDSANLDLVSMEEDSIALVGQGNNKAAIAILDSDRYKEQKEIYNQGLLDYAQIKDKEYSSILDSSTNLLTNRIEEINSRNIGNEMILIMIIFISLIIIGIFLSKKVTLPIVKLSKTVNQISKGDFKTEMDIESGITEINSLAESLSRIMATMKLAVLRKSGIRKSNSDKKEKGISSEDIDKSLSRNDKKEVLKKEVTEKTEKDSLKKIKGGFKKPLVTFPKKEIGKSVGEIGNDGKKLNKDGKKLSNDGKEVK